MVSELNVSDGQPVSNKKTCHVTGCILLGQLHGMLHMWIPLGQLHDRLNMCILLGQLHEG